MTAMLHPDQDFQRFLAAGRFMIQRSRSSGHYVFPPRIAEPASGSRDLEWVQASGLGTIYSLTAVSRKSPAPDNILVLVDLAEGPRILSRLANAAATVPPIGAAVKARILATDGDPCLVFELDESVEDSGSATGGRQ